MNKVGRTESWRSLPQHRIRKKDEDSLRDL